MNNFMTTLGIAMWYTAHSAAIESLKNTNVRSDMISAQELINLQTEAFLEAIQIVLLKDQNTDELWKSYFEKKDLIDTLTY